MARVAFRARGGGSVPRSVSAGGGVSGTACSLCTQFGKRRVADNGVMGRHTDHVSARRWLISGRVQGVGFRYFVQEKAIDLELHGFARNLDDGRVEVYATGSPEKLNELAAALHMGPRMAAVRGVDEREEPVRNFSGFAVR